jgi:DNA-directed RNA polymerase specialized sigma subunit
MEKFNASQLDAPYRALISGAPGSKDQMAVAAWPLLEIVVGKFIEKNPDARRLREELFGAAGLALAKAIDALTKQSKAKNLSAYLNRTMRNAMVDYVLEAPLIGASAATIRKERKQAKERAEVLELYDRRIEQYESRMQRLLELNAPACVLDFVRGHHARLTDERSLVEENSSAGRARIEEQLKSQKERSDFLAECQCDLRTMILDASAVLDELAADD